MRALRCILCRGELTGDASWLFCPNRECEYCGAHIPSAAARRLNALIGTYIATGNPTGRPPRKPLYDDEGASVWRCTCCGEIKPRNEMKADAQCSDGVSSWCLACSRA